MTDRVNRLEKLKAELEKAQARLKSAEGAEKKRQRKENDRRKYIHGGAFLAAMAKATPDDRRRLERFIDRHISRPTDRKFLGLEPLPSSPEEQKKSVTAKAPEQQLPLDFKKT